VPIPGRARDKIVEMEVRIFSNLRRPGVGLPPRRESSRPLLPQHARHCPVLEAGSTLGFVVYAPLEPKESVYVEHEGDGRYKLFAPFGLDWTGGPVGLVAVEAIYRWFRFRDWLKG